MSTNHHETAEAQGGIIITTPDQMAVALRQMPLGPRAVWSLFKASAMGSYRAGRIIQRLSDLNGGGEVTPGTRGSSPEHDPAKSGGEDGADAENRPATLTGAARAAASHVILRAGVQAVFVGAGAALEVYSARGDSTGHRLAGFASEMLGGTFDRRPRTQQVSREPQS